MQLAAGTTVAMLPLGSENFQNHNVEFVSSSCKKKQVKGGPETVHAQGTIAKYALHVLYMNLETLGPTNPSLL